MSLNNPNPYAAPQTAAPTASPYKNSTKPIPPFRAATGWGTVARVLLCISILGELGTVAANVFALSYYARMGADPQFSSEQISPADIAGGLVAVLNLFLLLMTAIAFLVWFHHVHRNLGSLRPYGKLEFSPGWAAGSFFVPILNLFRPYQIMQEVWRHSDPKQLDRHKKVNSTLVGWWWGGWVIANMISNASARMGFGDQQSAALLSAASWLDILQALISIATAVALVVLISRIDANQNERYELVLQTPKATPPSGPQNPFANAPPIGGFPPNWGGQFGERA